MGFLGFLGVTGVYRVSRVYRSLSVPTHTHEPENAIGKPGFGVLVYVVSLGFQGFHRVSKVYGASRASIRFFGWCFWGS